MTRAKDALRAGDRIAGPLVAVEPVGGGHACDVWLAFDEDRHSAVIAKVLRPERVADEHELSALRHEAALLDKVRHPAIVRLLDAELDAERPHLVLAHVDGPSLSALISKQGPLPLQQVLPLALELSAALHYLHGLGLCHLDVKPSNVVMGSPACLVDLGLARPTVDLADLTVSIGTDEYMAPEQCSPVERGPVGPASDVWCLGGTLFRAATGFRPFERDRRLPQLEQPPRELPGLVPADLADLIRSCLRPSPQDRPAPSEIAARCEDMIARLPRARLSGFGVGR